MSAPNDGDPRGGRARFRDPEIARAAAMKSAEVRRAKAAERAEARAVADVVAAAAHGAVAPFDAERVLTSIANDPKQPAAARVRASESIVALRRGGEVVADLPADAALAALDDVGLSDLLAALR